ncbi:hypothetical protein CONPUDRAFT_167405 [Coniophora puteana RWD-64-598 SS2]|uniref:HNH nuclease domain-containing protein n=1 Tax=Coniophora puteana (strain RWD-64-598) TaxID=741705 RepID=A0A5M3MGN2_CONPW|nr:uncharacterized protein CONPUDRAFT_167405 [Coniophora puteana RWD-64-598 SS2]EIW78382.1 hypothetical protein CONPUDRAFT_167405 [Coniophora puteana RWD-64-598 SS2]
MQNSQRSPSDSVASEADDDPCLTDTSQVCAPFLCPVLNKKADLVRCYIIPLDTDDRTRAHIEYAWGMGQQRLDLTGPSNILFVERQWRDQFYKHQWLLMPEPTIVRALLRLLKEDSASTAISSLDKHFEGQTSFKYYVIPWQALKHDFFTTTPPASPQHRRSRTHKHRSPLPAAARRAHIPCRTVHPYPFSTLPPITSHIKPHFAIWNICSQFHVSSGMDAHPLFASITATFKGHPSRPSRRPGARLPGLQNRDDDDDDVHADKLTMDICNICRYWTSRAPGLEWGPGLSDAEIPRAVSSRCQNSSGESLSY